MGLARQLAVARLAERRARPGGRLAEQLVEAGPRDQQQPVGGAGAGDGEPAERRVELVELRRAGERVDRDGDPVRLALPRVDGRREQVASRSGRASRAAARPRRWRRRPPGCGWRGSRRAGRPGRRPGDRSSISPVGVAVVVVRPRATARTRRRTARRAATRRTRQRQVDVGGLGVGEPVDLEQRRDAGARPAPRSRRRSPVRSAERRSRGRRARRRS